MQMNIAAYLACFIVLLAAVAMIANWLVRKVVQAATVVVLLDNANIFVSFQKHYRDHLPTSSPVFNYAKLREVATELPPLNATFEVLVAFGGAAWQLISTVDTARRRFSLAATAVGSSLGGGHMDHIWSQMRNAGWEVIVVNRMAVLSPGSPRALVRGDGRAITAEAGVDQTLMARMAHAADDCLRSVSMLARPLMPLGLYPRPTLVLATGDGNMDNTGVSFPDSVRRILEKGIDVEILAWSRSMSGVYRQLEAQGREATSGGGRVTVRPLEALMHRFVVTGDPARLITRAEADKAISAAAVASLIASGGVTATFPAQPQWPAGSSPAAAHSSGQRPRAASVSRQDHRSAPSRVRSSSPGASRVLLTGSHSVARHYSNSNRVDQHLQQPAFDHRKSMEGSGRVWPQVQAQPPLAHHGQHGPDLRHGQHHFRRRSRSRSRRRPNAYG